MLKPYVCALLGVVLVLAIPQAGGQSWPIQFDKESYSWTEKVRITIVAPSWNAHRHAIDTIGGYDEHSIRISSGTGELEPYRLAETHPNSGVFVGEITLTGFYHDADGDGDYDVTPRTRGSGPTDGLLETERDGAVTLSFQFTEDQAATKSVPVRWNVGHAEFAQEAYMMGQSASLRVYDADMNLNPEAVDAFEVDVVSDSDSAGIRTEMIETSESSGVFVADIVFRQSRASGGDRLYALPGDRIIATYDDHTLPLPYGRSDALDVTASTVLESDVHPLERMILDEITLYDESGGQPSGLGVGDQIQIRAGVSNQQTIPQGYVSILQITDRTDTVVLLGISSGLAGPSQTFHMSKYWEPEEPGLYTVQLYVWDSLDEPVPLAPSQSRSYTVR